MSIIDMIFAGDRPVDYRFVETNAAMEELSDAGRLNGRLLSEITPDPDTSWLGLLAEVANGAGPRRADFYSAASRRWFDVELISLDPAVKRVAAILTDITAQKESSAAVELSDERFRQAIAAGGAIGAWDWDIPEDRVIADENFARLYGVDSDLARQGAGLAEFFSGIHPDDIDRVRCKIDEAVASGALFSEEYRLVQPSGEHCWVLASGRAIADEHGQVTRLPGVSFDITARKQAEIRHATLLALSDRIRECTDPDEISFVAAGVLGHALGVDRVGYGVIDKEDETITIARDWNAPGVTTIAGTLRFRDYGSYIDDLKVGRTVAVADVRLDDRTRDTAAALEGIKARAFVNMPLIEQGGFVALIFASHGQPRNFSDDDLLLMREIAERVRTATERLRAEAARRASEEQFTVFAQVMPNHIWAARADGFLYWFNDQVLNYTGLSIADLSGVDGWGKVVHPDDLADAGSRWGQALATGSVYETEFRLRRRDGVYRWFLARAEAVMGASGAINGWVGSNTDIDDKRHQAAELERLAGSLETQVAERTRELVSAEEALRQSQKMEAVGQLTGGLAHDFNNLLTAIMGGLEIIGMRIKQGRYDDIGRYSEAAQAAARRAAALTHRLLAFSRRQTLDPRATDVSRLVNGMEELVGRTLGPQVALSVETQPGLWSTMVDANQLENALLNLVINARDAMPDGGTLSIRTRNAPLDEDQARVRDLDPGDYVALSVTDSGTGMSPEVIARAFDPFFTTKPLGEGTGLGLSMIYGFARQSGGQVRIDSEFGKGATFSIFLPRHHGADHAGEEIAPDTGATPRAGHGETVLVVDDEPGVRMLIAELLAELGYQLLEAEDAASGLALLESDVRIDLLVSDVGLPGGINGRQMADRARESRPDLRILFITGYAEQDVVGQGSLGRDMHVMTKPFELDRLGRRIRELIEGVA
jgi:PAS domain S-box-containing protein